MNYPYSVKANGKWYRPGEDVPDTQVEEKPVEVNVLLDGSAIQPFVPQIEEVQSEQAVEDAPKKPRGRRSSKD